MKKITIISTAFLLLFLSNIIAQEVAPLHLGNIWVYENDNGISLTKITVGDTNLIIDTVVYNKLELISNYGGSIPSYRYSRLKEDGFYAIRLDTSYPAPNHELLYYKKDAVIGATWTIPEPSHPPFDRVYTIEDTFVINVFGEATTVKYLKIDSGLSLFTEFWTENFGKLSRSDFGTPITSLQGCVIDGEVYGDTSFTIVSVENEFTIPGDFWLKQNYPNPFNPTTSIQYAIGSRQFVTIKVYDVLGNEIRTLVNQKKPAGAYNVEFDGSDLPTGTYFYRIATGSFIKTMKMLLLK